MKSRYASMLVTGIYLLALTHSAWAVDKLVTADANISTLVTANDTVLIWTGNHTVTVDASTAFTVSGINAGSFTATIAFGANDRKVLLGNSAGNVVIQSSGGSISVTGAGGGARTAGFLIPANVSGEIVEVSTSIDDADNANHWIIGNNTLKFTNSSARVGTVDIGSDSGVAMIDADTNAIMTTLTPTGDFSIDLASGAVLKLNAASSLGPNILSVTGASSTSQISATAGLSLNDATARLNITGTVSISDLDIGGSALISLADGASLTLTDAVAIGANTLTLAGTAGSSAETITATGGFTLNNAASQLKVNGDTANTLTVSKVDIVGADLTTGKLDIDENATFTALTISQNATLDIASGKTLGGTATLNAAKTLTHSSAGTLTTLNATTAAGTILMSGTGTISTLTNSIANTTVDVNESSSITTLAANASTTVDVATGKTLTTTATVGAGFILTSIGAGTISTVALNGTNAELNMTTAAGTIGTLNVTANGGILDADVSCTVNRCSMATTAGDLTVENGSQTITSASGFDVNENELSITQANGNITNVILDTNGGSLAAPVSTTVTTTTVSGDVEINPVGAATYQSVVNVAGGAVLSCQSGGTISTVNLDGAGAELNVKGVLATVTDVNVNANGVVIDVDQNCTLTDVDLASGAGDLTLEVAATRTLTADISVRNNRVTLTQTGNPGTLRLNASGARLDVEESISPTSVVVTANSTIDISEGKTMTTTLDIGSRTLTALGDGTFSRIDSSNGRFDSDGNVTISDLRLTQTSQQEFEIGGDGSTTITTINNSTTANGGTIKKLDSGSVTITGGLSTWFAKASGVHVDIDDGEVIVGSTSAVDDITFNDDGDEITIDDGATLTTFGSISVSAAGDNPNLDAAAGSTVNLRSAAGTESLTSAANDDFKLLGDVNIDGTNGDYSFVGAFGVQLGDVTINSTGSLINNNPSTTMLFEPGARITVDDGGTFTIDGQSSNTPIILTTTNGTGSFRLNRGASDNVTIANVALSRSEYSSDDGGAALDEIELEGVTDGGSNVNWFTPAQVDDDDSDDNENSNDNENDNGNANDNTNTNDNSDDTPPDTITVTASVDDDGSANAAVVSESTSAAAMVGIENALAGSLILTLADGNLRGDFAGIPDEDAASFTARIVSNLSGPFTAVIQLCYTQELLDDAGLSDAPLGVYVFDEDQGTWTLAGNTDQNQGDVAPTNILGDFGVDRDNECVWVVRDSLSDFAIGRVGAVSPDDDETPTPPRPLCGLLGVIPMTAMLFGVTGLKLRSRSVRFDW